MTQTDIPPPDTVSPTLPRSEWYCWLRQAIVDQEELERLLVVTRKEGVYRLGCTGLREAATRLLQEETHSQAVRCLLVRLEQAGLPPAYPCYIGVDLLTGAPSARAASGQVARNAVRLLYDLAASLLEVPELTDHPRREVLERCVETIMETCCEYTFSRIPPDSPHENVVSISLLPESQVVDELVFLRVVQCTELCFFTASQLAARALEAIAYSDALEVQCALHWIVCQASLLLPLLKLLAPMSVDSWLSFRPLIVRPSAIQSQSFHHLSTHLNEIQRVLHHPRYVAMQQAYLPCCQSLLSQAIKQLQTWYKAHLKIAAKYSRATKDDMPEGVRWLEMQQPLPALTATGIEANQC
jgi:hypothetical protein